jgi:hypothetical protein
MIGSMTIPLPDLPPIERKRWTSAHGIFWQLPQSEPPRQCPECKVRVKAYTESYQWRVAKGSHDICTFEVICPVCHSSIACVYYERKAL